MSEQVRQWINENARPLHDLSALPAIVGDAQVVGIGETTRAAHEIDHHRLRIFQVLVEELGFRTLAINDDAIIAERLDDLVRGSGDDPAETLGAAWPPWRTEETVQALQWIRAYNETHPDDPVRLLGISRPGAQQYHYDAIIDYVRRAAPQRLDEVKAHLAPPRSAHRIDEHVQRFQGIHPGLPFAESARGAYALVAALPEDDERNHVLRYAQVIVDHHSSTVAAGRDFGEWMGLAAESILERHDDTGSKIVFWDGIAITANAQSMKVMIGGGAFASVGAHLRDRLGPEYLSMLVGFGEGEIHEGVKVPTPPADYVETDLAAEDPYYLDLRAEAPDAVAQWLRGSHKIRLIPGVYDPAEDEKHHVVAPSLREWFDVLAFIPRITPTALLRNAG